MGFLIVFVGAGFGGAIRHAVNLAVPRLLPGLAFPLSTLVINVLGSVLMGILAESFALRGALASHPVRLLLTTGVLGGFTTFSTFSLDAVALYEKGEIIAAATYIGVSVAASLAGLLAALIFVRGILGPLGNA